MIADDVITLIAIMGDGKLLGKSADNRKGTVDSSVGTLCRCLEKRGFLTARNPGEYQPTAQGRKAILREIVKLVATKDEIWVKDRLEHLQGCYDDISQRIDTETQVDNHDLPAIESTVPYTIKTEAIA